MASPNKPFIFVRSPHCFVSTNEINNEITQCSTKSLFDTKKRPSRRRAIQFLSSSHYSTSISTPLLNLTAALPFSMRVILSHSPSHEPLLSSDFFFFIDAYPFHGCSHAANVKIAIHQPLFFQFLLIYYASPETENQHSLCRVT